MKILNCKVWFLIECDCGNSINLTQFVGEKHCEKCGRYYFYKIHQVNELVKEHYKEKP